MSVFHRVDDLEAMPAHRFVSLVERIAHYQGAIRHGAMLALQEDEQAAPQPEPEPSRPVDLAEQGNTDAMAIHPVWGQLGTYSKAPAE